MRHHMDQGVNDRTKAGLRVCGHELLGAEPFHYAAKRGHGGIQVAERCLPERRIRFRELPLAIADVSRAPKLGADVGVQVPGEV
jgi:hypothetical protein